MKILGFKNCLCVLAFALIWTGPAVADKTFVYCAEGSPSTFNPQMASDGITFNASSQPLYNRLVEFKNGTAEVGPGLAEKWEVSKDGLKFKFSLRKNVPFHTTEYFKPTRTFNADDVIFSFNRMRDMNHPFHTVGGGKYEYFDSMDMGNLIKDIQKINDYEVEFTLSRPEAPFFANLAMDFASILSAEYGAKLAASGTKGSIDTEPVGTGPFVFKKYVKDSTIRYTAFDKYFRGKPKIDQLVFAIAPDASVRTQKLKAGECHLVGQPNPSDLKMLEAEKNITVLKQAGLNISYLAMNTQKKPFDNVLVRRAINHALNRKNYIEAIYLGHAEMAKNPIPPTLWSYNKSVQDYEYNVDKAKALLKEAGMPNGFSAKLWMLPVSRGYNPNGKKMGELMKSDLEKIGVKIELVTMDWPTYLAKSKVGEHELIQFGWIGDNGDPDNFMNILLGCPAVESGSNYARWCNKDFNSLMESGRATTDLKKRTKAYMTAQEIFKKESPWVTIAHATAFKAMSKNISGYKMSPLGSDRFDEVVMK